jgi:hypothetical protein
VPVGGVLTWQASADPYEEQVGEVKPDVEAWLSSTYGQAQVDRFVQATLYG